MQILSHVKKIVSYFFITLVTLFMVIWGASFFILPWQVSEQLKPLGLTLNNEASLSFNPFNLHIKIDDLAIINKDKVNQLTLKHAHLNVSWLDVVTKDIVIEMGKIDSLHINVVRNQEQLIIAGIDLSKDTSQAPAISTEPQLATNNEDPLMALKGWSFNIPNFSLNDLALNIDDLGQSQKIVLRKLSIDALSASLTSFKARMMLDAAINDSSLTINTDVKAVLKSTQLVSAIINNKVNLSEFSLQDWQYLMPLNDHEISELGGLVNLSVNQKMELKDNQWQLEQPKLRLILNDIKVVKPELELINESFAFDLNKLVVNGDDNAITNITGDAQLMIDKVSVMANGQPLTTLSTFELQQSDFSVDEKFDAVANIANITLKEIMFSKPNDAQKALYFNDELTINDIVWQKNHLSIDNINLGKFNSEVVLSANKEIKNLVSIEQSQPEVENKPDTTSVTEELKTEETSQAVTISLNKFELTSPSNINFTDESVTPIFKHQIVLNKAVVNTIDSRDKSFMSPFDIDFSLGEHAKTTIIGSIAPFNEKMNLTLDVNMSEFSLPPLSSYLRTVLGFDFLTGQLDNKVNIVIKDDVMAGETIIDLRGFELASGDDSTDVSVSTGSAMGLNSALNMLKDSQGNVSLDIPLSGDINDPSFGMSSVLTLVAKKAIMSQAKSYLVNTFVPYANVISVVSIAGEYLLRLKMNDLVYDVGQVALNEKQQPYIKELAALLKDKPEQQVKMCSIASMEEGASTGATTDDQKITLLKALSTQRGNQLKKTLIENHYIESARLLLCAPKIDNTSDSLPRIEFSF